MASGMESSHRGFRGHRRGPQRQGNAGPPSGGGDGFAREASAGTGTSDRPGRRACGRARGRWSVRLGGRGRRRRFRARLEASASTPAAGAAEGGLDGPGADVGARAAEGFRNELPADLRIARRRGRGGRSGGPARPGLSRRPPAQPSGFPAKVQWGSDRHAPSHLQRRCRARLAGGGRGGREGVPTLRFRSRPGEGVTVLGARVGGDEWRSLRKP